MQVLTYRWAWWELLDVEWNILIPNTVARSGTVKYVGSINNTNQLTSSVNEIFVYTTVLLIFGSNASLGDSPNVMNWAPWLK